MFSDDKKKNIVKLSLRVVVAGYIGYIGVMLVKGYIFPPEEMVDPATKQWPDASSGMMFLYIGIFFLLVSVGFIVYSLISFFKTRSSVQTDQEITQEEGMSEGSSGTRIPQAKSSGNGVLSGNSEKEKTDEKKKLGISDIAKYKSEDI